MNCPCCFDAAPPWFRLIYCSFVRVSLGLVTVCWVFTRWVFNVQSMPVLGAFDVFMCDLHTFASRYVFAPTA